jgi:MobA/MobL family
LIGRTYGFLRNPRARTVPCTLNVPSCPMEERGGICLMAIYSLHHSKIGRSTHVAGTAAAHIRYIARKSACPVVLAFQWPKHTGQAGDWILKAEEADRKNARVVDKIMVALPRELTPAQRSALVASFAQTITQTRAPWFAAIHQTGRDSHNPHAHLVIRDRDIATGKRVANLSEKDSTTILRTLWQDMANKALQEAGSQARIDHRSNAARGLPNAPKKHEGYICLPKQIKPIQRPQKRVSRTFQAVTATILSPRPPKETPPSPIQSPEPYNQVRQNKLRTAWHKAITLWGLKVWWGKVVYLKNERYREDTSPNQLPHRKPTTKPSPESPFLNHTEEIGFGKCVHI